MSPQLKRTLTTIGVTAGLSFVLGLTVGMRGCEDASVTKLLEENARLKIESEKHRADAMLAATQRDNVTKAREATLAELREHEVAAEAAEESIATLRGIVRERTAAAKCKPERDLIAALDEDRAVKRQQIDLLTQAVDAAQKELELGHSIEASLNASLAASEKRADLLEKKVLKGRKQKIAIGVGSALGSAALTLGAVSAAGRLN
jgi:hypothetical protein